ncbi:MAG: hypothetical protein ACXADY_17380 [Candidatus Hodarchaeales archaeon]|jgi:hypothetical protein
MTQTEESYDSILTQEETTLTSKVGISILLSFGIILLLETVAFITIGMFTSQITGVMMIPINLLTIGLMLFGAVVATYYYYTRYVKKELILTQDGLCLMIGKRSFDYLWSDFSLVALSVSHTHYGAKGFIIKLFVDDLDGEYVDLPIYRFPKSINVFDLRNQIEKKVRDISK